MNTMWLFIWLAAAIIFGIIEIVTIQLVAIWFSIGSVVAMIACSFGAPIWIQIMLFGVASLILLPLTRPFVKKVLKIKHINTNADRLIGKEAIVTETISNLEGHGAVKISGVVWTARSLNDDIIEKDEKVIIKSIEGVKLIVTKSVI